VWRLFGLLQDTSLLQHDVYAPLRAFLEQATEAKRYGLARRIAERFDEYRLYRPEVLVGWEDRASGLTSNVHEPWQAALWQELLGHERPAHFARWFLGTLAQLETIGERPQGLPHRIAVFGVSTLPPLFVRLLRAVSRFVPVTYYVLLPTAPHALTTAPGHPLFERFGQSSRDLLTTVLTPDHTGAVPPVEHVRTSEAAGARTVLQQLQRALRTSAITPLVMAKADRSLSVHVCHSPMRELEVLRDQLLDAFADDPTLRPHDVLIMAPDVEQYAHLMDAIFGHAQGREMDGAPAIPFRVADRTLARESAAARALMSLLSLVTARFTASEVLELLSQPLVRHAAGITAGDVDQVTTWIEEAAIRWGYDGAARAERHGVPVFEENSWRSGLDRLLAGYAAGRTASLVGGVLPVAGDLVGDATLLGAFVEWTEQLFARVDALRADRPLGEWTAVLQETVAWLVASDEASERAMIDQVARDLGRLADLTSTRGSGRGQLLAIDQPVAFDVVRNWVADALASEEQGSAFLSGGMTLCAMKPMRAIPHRIIAMLGLDDRAYPRRLRRSAFDIIATDPRLGDRDPRADDRQLILDTLMSAGDRLVLSYVGRSQKSNAELAPSIVVAELLDQLDAMSDGEVPPSKQLRVVHQLQPFSPAYFTQAESRDQRLFSFDVRLAASVAGSVIRHDVPPFLSALPPAVILSRDWQRGADPFLAVTLDDLMDTWLNPSKVYCRRILQLTVSGDESLVEDVEPTGMDGLLRYQLQQDMLEAAVHGRRDSQRERALAVAAGVLPVGALGVKWHERLRSELAPQLHRIGTPQFSDPLSIEVAGSDWVLTGHLGYQQPHEQWRIRAAKLNAKDKARAWIAHVVRCAAAEPVATRVIARDQDLVLPPLTDAMRHLDFLVQGARAVRTAPLPYFLEAACAYRGKVQKGEPGIPAAVAAYNRNDDYGTGDIADPYVQLLWRGWNPVDDCAEQFAALADGFWSTFDGVTAK
jgi:exodeoxyribonuclease V gamma subunit